MQFYISYILIITLLLLLDYFSKDKGRVVEGLVIIIIILISGLRDYTGYDFKSYSDSYQTGVFDYVFEPGFVLYMDILRFFNADYHIMFFLMSLVTYILLYLAIRRFTPHAGIAIIIYMLIPGLYLNSLSIIRQAFAIVISFYCFSLLINKKYWPYFILMLLGTSFHYSCIIILPFHFLVWKYAHRLKIIHYAVVIGISLVIAKLNLTQILSLIFVGMKYESYSEGEPVSFAKLLVLNSFIIIILFFYKKLLRKQEYNAYFLVFTTLGIILLNCFSSVITLTRISYYFRIFEIVLAAEFIYLFSKKSRIVVLLVFYVYYFSIFYTALVNDSTAPDFGPKMIPYKNIFI